MAKRTELKAPVDGEDNDRRLNPQVDAQPSTGQDEHRGLAARLARLRAQRRHNAISGAGRLAVACAA